MIIRKWINNSLLKLEWPKSRQIIFVFLIPVLIAALISLISFKVTLIIIGSILCCILIGFIRLKLVLVLLLITNFFLQAFSVPSSAYIIITNSLFALLILYYYINRCLCLSIKPLYSPKDTISALLLVFALISIISLIYNSTYSLEAFMEVTRYISLVALFLILFHFISDLDKLKNAVWVIITISILTAIYSYYLVFDMGIKTFLLSGISAFHSLHGGLGNANSLAFLIGISIPIIFSHLLYSRQKNKLFSVILLIFLFIIWLLCNSRSSYVYLLVSVIFIFFFHRKRRLYLGISIIIASIIFVLIFISPVIQQLVRLESGLSHRDELWKGAFRMFTNSPFIGMGPLSFNDFKFYYVDAGIAREICAYQFGGAAHNLYLTKAAELGIFSVIIIFALWGYITWYFFANRKHIQKQPLNYLYIACGAIFTGLMFRSIFEIGGLIGNGRLGENLLPLLIVAMIIRIPMLYKNGEK